MSRDPLWFIVSGWLSGWLRHGFALTLSAGAGALALLFPALAADRLFALPFLAAILVSAHAAGFGAGMTATGVAALGVAYFLPPNGTLQIAAIEDVTFLGAFASVASATAFLAHKLAQASRLRSSS